VFIDKRNDKIASELRREDDEETRGSMTPANLRCHKVLSTNSWSFFKTMKRIVLQQLYLSSHLRPVSKVCQQKFSTIRS